MSGKMKARIALYRREEKRRIRCDPDAFDGPPRKSYEDSLPKRILVILHGKEYYLIPRDAPYIEHVFTVLHKPYPVVWADGTMTNDDRTDVNEPHLYSRALTKMVRRRLLQTLFGLQATSFNPEEPFETLLKWGELSLLETADSKWLKYRVPGPYMLSPVKWVFFL